MALLFCQELCLTSLTAATICSYNNISTRVKSGLDPALFPFTPLIPELIILSFFRYWKGKIKTDLKEQEEMVERILKVRVFVLLVVAACIGLIANAPLAGSREPVQVTVFKPPA